VREDKKTIMKQFRHGKTAHPYFPRWNGFIQRCYCPTNSDYANYGGRGIRVDYVWSQDNPEGVINFLHWFDEQLKQFLIEHPEYTERRIEIGRKNVDQNFGPDNCVIRLVGESTRVRRIAKLTAEGAIAIRRHLRMHPTTTLPEMEKLFHVGPTTISRVLTGVLWECVNNIEPPIPKRSPVKRSEGMLVAA
jgi:hypothetical protein